MRDYFRLFLLGVFLLTSAGFTAKESSAVSLYVSQYGHDSWSGKLPEPNSALTDGPFATLEKARDEIRTLKREGALPEGGVTVNVREGTYIITETFKLSDKDSGTKDAPILWRAFLDDEVRFIGGREITGFKAITDPSVLGRIDKTYSSKILQVNLRAQGVIDYGEIELRGGPGLELFLRDKRMPISRWPNEGWVKVAGVPQTGKLDYEGRPNKNWSGRHYGRFTYEGSRPERWSNLDDIILQGYWYYDWYDAFLKIKSIDFESREIYHVEGPNFGYRKGQRYCALNVLEELDIPGEWCLDRRNGILYFLPPAPITGARMIVSILDEPLVSLENTEYITIQGINFTFSRGIGITIRSGIHNLVAGCTFANLGEDAVIIDGGMANGITGCNIYDVAAGGIMLRGGDRASLTPGGNYAVNNHIYNYSLWRRTYNAAISVMGVGSRLAHNLIHDAPHTGILLGGNEHIIEYNELYNLAKQTGDVGAFYMGRNWTQRGNIIRYNYFHDLFGPGQHGVMAVYLDDFTSGTTIFGNVFYRAGRSAFIGGGRDNIVENNIFVECAPSAHVDGRGLAWARYYFNGNFDVLFERMDEMNFRKPPYSEKYPVLLKLYEDDPAVPKYNKILRNVSYGGRWLDLYNELDFSIVTVKDNLIADPELCKWLKKGEKEFITYKYGDREMMDILKNNGNMVIAADPGFLDLENLNFQLKDDSPAYKLGFRRIPIEKIGLYVDEYRASLPKDK